MIRVAAVLSGLLVLAAVQFSRVAPDAYGVFLATWTPSNKPFCAAIGSSAQWHAIFEPAAVMGRNRPFSPPDSLWRDRAMLVVARVVPAGDPSHVFVLTSISEANGALVERYSFNPTAPASSTMKWWMGIIVQKPLPAKVAFVENGRRVCDLDVSRGRRRSP